MTCICGHRSTNHRHMLFDDSHPYVEPGMAYLAPSTGPCTEPGCNCDHFFPLPAAPTSYGGTRCS